MNKTMKVNSQANKTMEDKTGKKNELKKKLKKT
jgi:hypothetical protein